MKYIQAFSIFKHRTFSLKELQPTENIEIQSAALRFWLQSSLLCCETHHELHCQAILYHSSKRKASSSLKDEGRGHLLSPNVNY